MAKNFDSPYYPYEHVHEGYLTLRGSEKIPLMILRYLLDLPDQDGYVPTDDNERPRVRLAKYLWWDGARPLDNDLPTASEKLSMLFNGDEPVLNTDEQKEKHPKGYRLVPEGYILPAELSAKTIVECWVGRISPQTYTAQIALNFRIIVNSGIENTTRTDAYSRSYAIEQCLVEALNGVNMTGIGTIRYDRSVFTDNGSKYQWDEGTHIYRNIIMSLDWAESTMPDINPFEM